MPEAPVPAARRALDAAGHRHRRSSQAIKTHNPFVVNDIVLADALGVDARGDEPLRLLARLGPSAGADRPALARSS